METKLPARFDYTATVKPVFTIKRQNIIYANPISYTQIALNTDNGETIFDISSYDNPISLNESVLILSCEFKKDASTALAPTDNTAPINNFPPALFSNAVLEINGERVETNANPYISSTVMTFVSDSYDQSKTEGQQNGLCITQLRMLMYI